MAINSAFNDFPDEAALIGRILADYATLELDLMYCAKAVNDDLDTVLKSMFKIRGETRRINVANRLGRTNYNNLGIGPQFRMAVNALKYCLKIRNQYAHWIWWDDRSGQLAFANLENVANQNELIPDLNNLIPHHINVTLLNRQITYYEYTDSMLFWVIHERNRIMERPHIPNLQFPEPIERPPLFI